MLTSAGSLLAGCFNTPSGPVEEVQQLATGDVKLPVPAALVTASSHDGNVPANTVDGNLGTRWSASGDGQWIRYDLFTPARVAFVRVAFYNGTDRTFRFDVQTSGDGATWTTALAGALSARNNNRQDFDFPDVASARYLRLVGHGNSSSAWNSYTEVEIYGGPACVTGAARCVATGREVCSNGTWQPSPCAPGTVCTGEGVCGGADGCTNGAARCVATGREVCSNGTWQPSPCAPGTVCTGDGACTDSCVTGASRCAASGRQECVDNQWIDNPCEPGLICTGAGLCQPPATAIANLVVNDTANGGDGIANNTQWTVLPSFGGGAGQRAFNDRTFTISALPAAAAHLAGRPWIRTAADSKAYTATPTLATANVTGSFVFLAVDSRHSSTFLTSSGFAAEPYSLTVLEGTTPRTYRVWKKAVSTSGGPFSFPRVGSTTAPCYFVIAE